MSQNKKLLPKIKFYQGDIVEDEYFKDTKFDIIIANGILEHVIDLNKFLKKIKLLGMALLYI